MGVASASPGDANQPREAEDQRRHDASDQEPQSRAQPAIEQVAEAYRRMMGELQSDSPGIVSNREYDFEHPQVTV